MKFGYDSTTREVFMCGVDDGKWKLLWDSRASESSSAVEETPFAAPSQGGGEKATNAPGQSSNSNVAERASEGNAPEKAAEKVGAGETASQQHAESDTMFDGHIGD